MPALDDEARHRLLVQIFAGNRDGRCPLAPEMEEMRLAATRRTMQHQRPGRPVGPPVDPADGRGIAVRNEKIGAAQRGAAGQIEGELASLPTSDVTADDPANARGDRAHNACSERPRMRAHRTR